MLQHQGLILTSWMIFDALLLLVFAQFSDYNDHYDHNGEQP